jgi:type I restriction enzyme S subunit
MANLNTSIMSQVPIIVSPDEVMRAFDAIPQLLMARLIANDVQAETLGSLRDTLLPKLISGEVRVPEAARVMEAAGG